MFAHNPCMAPSYPCAKHRIRTPWSSEAEKSTGDEKQPFRRQILKAAAGAMLALNGTVLVTAEPTGQSDWRLCEKCRAMFFNGYQSKGHCPAGGSHVAVGSTFSLPHDLRGTPTTQTDWRFCSKCEAMFYDGRPGKGRCGAGGSHVAQGFNFVLPHDVQGTTTTQAGWRFCSKCQVMFYDGLSGFVGKGHCAVGGGHEAQGYNFVLPHLVDTCSFCNDESCQCGPGTAAERCAAHGGHNPSMGANLGCDARPR